MNSKGYTLIEILIALSVFAILAVITSSAMHHAFTTRSRVNKQADRLNELQLAMTILQRDAKQMVDRAIRTENMQLIPSFIGDARYIEFTRDGLVNPNSREKRSTLKRIAYLCQKNKLIRRSWEVLDIPEKNKFNDKVLLDGLNHCKFAYLTHSRQLLLEWKPNALQQNQKEEPLPIAIQFDLDFEVWGNMNVLFIVPEALYGQ